MSTLERRYSHQRVSVRSEEMYDRTEQICVPKIAISISRLSLSSISSCTGTAAAPEPKRELDRARRLGREADETGASAESYERGQFERGQFIQVIERTDWKTHP